MNKTRRIKAMIAGILLSLAALVAVADDVTPSSIENDCYRSASGSPLQGTFYRGSSLLLTNWVAFSDASGTTTQNLADCAVYIVMGDSTQTSSYTATVDVAASGTFYTTVTVTTNSTATQYIEVEVQNTNTLNNYVYPWYSFLTTGRLGS